MHQNAYDHERSEPRYRRYIHNIAYRFNFQVVFEEDRVLVVADGKETALVSTGEVRRNTLAYHAWLKLQEEYGYNGI